MKRNTNPPIVATKIRINNKVVMRDFITQIMQNFVRIINKDNYNDFITSHSERYHVLLFTSKKTTPPLFKSLSKDYLNHLSFGEIRQSETELIKNFNVDNIDVEISTIFYPP